VIINNISKFESIIVHFFYFDIFWFQIANTGIWKF